MADNVRTWTGVTPAQAQLFVEKAEASGFSIEGQVSDGVLHAEGHGFKFFVQYHDGDATVTIEDKPFLVPDSVIFATLNGFIQAAHSGNVESMHEVWKGVAKPLCKLCKPHFVKYDPSIAYGFLNQDVSFFPREVAKLYGFPTDVDGTGQTVAIIELGGGYLESDLKAAGIDPSKVSSVSVQGAQNSPGGDADGEVALDIQIVAAIAPGASIKVYFAPNTDAGFAAAVEAAKADSVGSISWGGPETSWEDSGRNLMDSAFRGGPVWFVASGDSLASDGSGQPAVTDFPASSPLVTGCGGTKITVDNGKITAEVAWNDGRGGGTGGGVSAKYPVPDFQKGITFTTKSPAKTKPLTGRGVPDVASVSDPACGYKIFINGSVQVVGGTSSSSPLFAGLLALLQQKAGKPLPRFKEDLYEMSAAQRQIALKDVNYGDNVFYKSTTGWDPCTGWGSPGLGLESLLNQFAK